MQPMLCAALKFFVREQIGVKRPPKYAIDAKKK